MSMLAVLAGVMILIGCHIWSRISLRRKGRVSISEAQRVTHAINFAFRDTPKIFNAEQGMPSWGAAEHTTVDYPANFCFGISLSAGIEQSNNYRVFVEKCEEAGCLLPVAYDHERGCLLVPFKTREEALLFKLTHGGAL